LPQKVDEIEYYQLVLKVTAICPLESLQKKLTKPLQLPSTTNPQILNGTIIHQNPPAQKHNIILLRLYQY